MKKSFFILSFSSLLIVACGQTGPLMLPVKDHQDDEVMASTLTSQPKTTDSVATPVPPKEKK